MAPALVLRSARFHMYYDTTETDRSTSPLKRFNQLPHLLVVHINQQTNVADYAGVGGGYRSGTDLPANAASVMGNIPRESYSFVTCATSSSFHYDPYWTIRGYASYAVDIQVPINNVRACLGELLSIRYQLIDFNGDYVASMPAIQWTIDQLE